MRFSLPAPPRALAATAALLLSLSALSSSAQDTPAPAQPKPTAASVAKVAQVLIVDSTTPPPVDLARWGLTVEDMSLLDSSALLKKSKVEARAGELAKARDKGDPIATYLSHLLEMQLGRSETGREYGLRAAKLGVVRAISMLAASNYLNAETPEEEKDALTRLRRAAMTRSAYGAYWLGNALMMGNMGSGSADKSWLKEASSAMGFAAEAGYAPAQLHVARMAFGNVDGGNTDPKLRQQAQTLLDRAVAQGYPEAIEYAAGRKGR
jgi:TPR repeat protein